MANKIIKLCTKRLCIVSKTIEELEKEKEKSQNSEVQKLYQDRLDKMEKKPEDWLWYTDWTIMLKKEKTVVGVIGFKGAPDSCGEVEIRCEITESCRKQGFGTEALKQMTEWAFQKENVYYILAQTKLEDEASQKLFKKAGFQAAEEAGEEGLRFELVRPVMNYMSIYLSLGMSVGVCWGISMLDNLALGMSMGMLFGVALGVLLEQQDKKKREKYEQERRKRQNAMREKQETQKVK